MRNWVSCTKWFLDRKLVPIIFRMGTYVHPCRTPTETPRKAAPRARRD